MFFIYGLLENGDFQKKVSKNTYWVPINTLGNRSYNSLEEYQLISRMSIKDKKRKVLNLYDAVLLFICSEFRNDLGVKHVNISGIEWETYQSGIESVEKNSGCCSSCASWLSYMLEGIYEEIGMLLIMRYGMSGHCINYIRHKNKLYFIDMQTFTMENLRFRVPETGEIRDFMNAKYITSIFVEASSFEDYVNYHRRLMRNIVKDFIFIKINMDTCIPSGIKNQDYSHIYLPQGFEYDVIECEHPLDMNYEIKDVDISALKV